MKKTSDQLIVELYLARIEKRRARAAYREARWNYGKPTDETLVRATRKECYRTANLAGARLRAVLKRATEGLSGNHILQLGQGGRSPEVQTNV